MRQGGPSRAVAAAVVLFLVTSVSAPLVGVAAAVLSANAQMYAHCDATVEYVSVAALVHAIASR